MICEFERRQKLAVFGYIRQKADIFLPVEIIKLFVAFYKSQDDWDRVLSHFTIEVDDDYIATSTSSQGWCIGFGQDRVRSRVKEWVLKMFKIDSAIIGIVPSKQISTFCNSGDYTDRRHALKGYGLCGPNGVFYGLGNSRNRTEIGFIHSQDIVVVRLDFNTGRTGRTSGTLSYKINDDEYKVATESVSIRYSWSLAVAFLGRGKVQLLK